MEKIQIIAIGMSFLFLWFVVRLIIKGKLREEYSIFWIFCTAILILFSFWRNGLMVMSKLMGVYEAPNLIFTVSIFAILIYLLHLSIMVSKLQSERKQLSQEIALLKEKMKLKME